MNQPLDYVSPPKRATSRPLAAVLAAVAGTLAVVLSALLLFYGVSGIILLLKGPHSRRDTGGITEVVTHTLIGIVCAFLASRWLRYAIKRAQQ